MRDRRREREEKRVLVCLFSHNSRVGSEEREKEWREKRMG